MTDTGLSIALARRVLVSALLLPCALGLAACSQDGVEQQDPLYTAAHFHPVHANRSNLVLMVANPADLVRGQSGAPADGQLAAAAVDRLRNDKLKKLPAADIAQISTSSSGDNNQTGGGTQ